jgi:N-acetylglutamate synthase-like GNAT family acetyltransferase
MTIISQAKPQDIEDIKGFYNQCGYGGGLGEHDLILIARSEAKLVGAVRLCSEQDFFVLRGMQVIAPFQRQGIGTQLLWACAENLASRTCYCIPWQHLRSFYEQAGFQEVASTVVPDFLRERLEGYQARDMKVAIMRRLPVT